MKIENVKPGDLYKVITVAGRAFEIRYLDYGALDPHCEGEVSPDFPYFAEEPEYTDDHYPFTNYFTDCCEHYKTNTTGRPDKSCHDCIYFKDAVEDIGVCRCTARRLRGVGEPMTGKPMKIAVIGNLPTAEKVIRDCYLDVSFDNYCCTTDLTEMPSAYDLIIVESYAGEGLGMMDMTAKYKTNTDEEVTVPIKLLAEPVTDSVEEELSAFVKDVVAPKLNKTE